MRHTIKSFNWWIAIGVAFMVVFLAACSGTYGKFRYSKEVGQAFQDLQMLDNYEYFYSGRANRPSAIIGIDPEFEFSSRFWTSIDSDEFETMVGRMSPPEYGFLNGSYILTPDERQAGVWYSWVNIASVKFDGNQIMIPSPEPFSEIEGAATGRALF